MWHQEFSREEHSALKNFQYALKKEGQSWHITCVTSLALAPFCCRLTEVCCVSSTNLTSVIQEWGKLVVKSFVVPHGPSRLRDRWWWWWWWWQFCMISVVVCIWSGAVSLHNWLSSANARCCWIECVLISSNRGCMYKTKRTGSKTEPWGTPKLGEFRLILGH